MSDFWARRKAAVQAETQAEERARVEALQAVEAAELEERSDEDLLQEAGLPEPETLESAEAVRDFLRAELPQRLKTRALRHLWRMNPLLANLDGLVDYGEDFTDSATVVENLQTVYQVGKGMFVQLEEAIADDPEPPEESKAETPEIDAAPEPETEPEALVARQETLEPVAVAMEEPAVDPDPLPATSRRMRFEFAT